MAIHCCVRASFSLLLFTDRIDQRSIDAIDLPIDQITIEPTQHFLVSLERGLVGLLVEPTNHRVLPAPLWPIPKLLDPPDFASQLVVQFLRLAPTVRLQRAPDSSDRILECLLPLQDGIVVTNIRRVALRVLRNSLGHKI